MQDDVATPDELQAQLGTVFRGPLDEFISRRDALVKVLRAAGRTDEAEAVKRLRKPTRAVWALDAAVLDDRGPVERVAGAVIEMLGAQEGRGSVRDATVELRESVRNFAGVAARAAADAGYRVDQAELVPAVMAVIGDAEAFEALRAGRLVELPAGSELDVLTGAPQLAPVTTPIRAKQPAPPPAADPAAIAEAEAAVGHAEADAAAASDRLAAAERDLDAAAARADAAEARRQRAEAEAREARTALREAQQAARAAGQVLRTADREAARARSRLDQLTTS